MVFDPENASYVIFSLAFNILQTDFGYLLWSICGISTVTQAMDPSTSPTSALCVFVPGRCVEHPASGPCGCVVFSRVCVSQSDGHHGVPGGAVPPARSL